MTNATLIDAVAMVLYPTLDPGSFNRISDEVVRFGFDGEPDMELRQVEGKTCLFQTIGLRTGKVATQFDFSRLIREYVNYPGDGFYGEKIRLLGDNMFCLRISGEARCYSSHDITVGGINGLRRLLKSLAYIQKNHCPPKD